MECDNNIPFVISHFHKRKRKLLKQLINGFSLDIGTSNKPMKSDVTCPKIFVDKPAFAILVDNEFCLICGVKGLLRNVSVKENSILKQQNLCAEITSWICTVCEVHLEKFIELNDNLQTILDKIAEMTIIFKTVITFQNPMRDCHIKEDSAESWKNTVLPRPINIADIVQKFDSDEENEIFLCEDSDLQLTDDDSDENANQWETNKSKCLSDQSMGEMVANISFQPKPTKPIKKPLKNKKPKIISLFCSICLRRFPDKWKLKRHEVSHAKGTLTTGEHSVRSFSCSICRRKFPDTWKLRRHEATHKSQLTQLPSVSNPAEVPIDPFPLDNGAEPNDTINCLQELSAEMPLQPASPSKLNENENLVLNEHPSILDVVDANANEAILENGQQVSRLKHFTLEAPVQETEQVIPNASNSQRCKRQSRLRAEEMLKSIDESDNSANSNAELDMEDEDFSSSKDNDIEGKPGKKKGSKIAKNIERDKNESSSLNTINHNPSIPAVAAATKTTFETQLVSALKKLLEAPAQETHSAISPVPTSKRCKRQSRLKAEEILRKIDDNPENSDTDNSDLDMGKEEGEDSIATDSDSSSEKIIERKTERKNGKKNDINIDHNPSILYVEEENEKLFESESASPSHLVTEAPIVQEPKQVIPTASAIGRCKRQSRLKAEEMLRAIDEQDNSDNSDTGLETEDDVSSSSDSDSEDDSKSEKDKGKIDVINIEKNKDGRYPCPICNQTFVVKPYAEKHAARHGTLSDVKPFKCDECNEKWTTIPSLEEHHRLDHKNGSEEGEIPCEFCGKKFLSKEGYKTHWKIFHKDTKEGTYHCYNCKTSFETPEDLETHYSDCAGSLCYPCKILVPKQEWEKHLKKWTHMMEQEFITVVEKKTFKGDYLCRFCKDDNTFPSEDAFLIHLKEIHNRRGRFYCKPCNQDSTSLKGYITHLTSQFHARNIVAAEDMSQAEMEKIMPFSCSHCDKRFTTLGICNRHEKRHTREAYLKPSVCEICGKSFQTLGGLVAHRNRGHPETRKGLVKKKPDVVAIKCNQCPKKFTRQRYLTMHIQRIHEPSRKYDCDVCGKTYTNKTGVRNHKFIKHNDEKTKKEKEKLVCPVPSCKKQVARARLFAHMEVHHFIPYETCPYECGWQNGTEEEWKKHVEICCNDKELQERGVSCRRCGESFSSVFLRFLHFIKEHPDFSFPCTFCPRVFSQGSAFSWHKASHTEIKPFQCTKCGKRFPQENNLKIHLNSVCTEDQEARKAFVAKRKEKQKEFMEKKKPWKCSKCGKGFIEERRMIAHQNAVHKEESGSKSD